MVKKTALIASIFLLPILFLQVFFPLDELDAKIKDSLTLKPDISEYNLNPYVEVLKDPTNELELEDIMSGDYSDMFQVHQDESAPSYTYTDSAIWIRFNLQKSKGLNNDFFLEVAYPLLSQIDFFIPQEDEGYLHKKAGALMPFGAREIEHRNFLFEIPSEWQEDENFLLRVKTDSAMIIPLKIWDSGELMSKTEVNYLGFGIYYGLISIIVLYSFFLFIFSKEINYLFYVVFIASMGLFLFTFNGLSFQYLWPNNPWWAKNAINFFLLMGTASGIFFTRKVLPVNKYSSLLDASLKFLGISAICLLPLTFILDFSLVMQVGIGFVLASALVTLSAALICWYKKFRPAIYLFFGFFIFAAGIILMALRSLGILPDSFITTYGAQIGFSGKVIFIFIGLADHMYTLRKQKEITEEENKSLELERKKLVHSKTLNTMLQDISITDDIKTISKKLLDYIDEIIPYNFACFLSKTQGKYNVIARSNGSFSDNIKKYDQVKKNYKDEDEIQEEFFCQALEAEKPVLIADINEYNPFQQYTLQKDTTSAIIIPITSKTRHFGIVVLENKESNVYRDVESNLAMNFAGQASLAIENASLYQGMNTMAITDELTKLYNRRHLYNVGKQEFNRVKRYGTSLSLIIMDIDDFKDINDTFGHSAGDEVLIALTNTCMENLRKVDVACRYGGEEFAFLLPETGLDSAKKTAEKLRHAIASKPITIKEDDYLNVTASFGVSTVEKKTLSFDQIVDKADEALYRAKENGKNIVF